MRVQARLERLAGKPLRKRIETLGSDRRTYPSDGRLERTGHE
jgi:hypothetical protein